MSDIDKSWWKTGIIGEAKDVGPRRVGKRSWGCRSILYSCDKRWASSTALEIAMGRHWGTKSLYAKNRTNRFQSAFVTLVDGRRCIALSCNLPWMPLFLTSFRHGQFRSHPMFCEDKWRQFRYLKLGNLITFLLIKIQIKKFWLNSAVQKFILLDTTLCTTISKSKARLVYQ